MKQFLLFLFSFFLLPFCYSQKVIDLKVSSNVERADILNALRTGVKKELKQDVKFVVDYLKMQGNHAFLKGKVNRADGKEIDFSKTIYAEQAEEGMFDGNSIYALLKKVNGKWKKVVHVIGPTDVAWACWWKEYKAPRQVFDHAEDCDW